MEDQNQQDTSKKTILALENVVNSVNVAENLSDEELDSIAGKLHQSIYQDERSMNEWLKRNNEYLELALQIKKKKSFPWANAANIKYPILTIAALQFQARAYPALVDGKKLVKGKVIGYDPDGSKTLKAERIGKHMTYQLMEQVENWDEDMDKLCLILPIAGCVFKDIGWDSMDDKAFIDLVLPTDMIINYWAASMEDARRITRKLYFYKNTILEKQAEGTFLDIDLSPPTQKTKTKEEEERQLKRHTGGDEEDTPYLVYKCQTYLDLDNDGYSEPYMVLLTDEDKKILRITPNFSLTDIKKNAAGDIVRIKPKKNFIKYDMFPSPDGGILGVGFGLFLGSLNEVVNTSVNQLLDQGTMLTTSGGFIAKGVKLKGGKQAFEPNEWKVVQTSGDDLRKGIVPLPIREPSPVLLQLFSAIDQKSSQVMAISEIATGKLPGQNTPATTTISSIEEGMKVFTAVYKRVHRQLKKEFKILFALNRDNITDEEYFMVLDSDGTEQKGKVSKEDYNTDTLDVVPESDPNNASDALRLLKAQGLMELINTGAVDPVRAGQRILIAMDQPNPQELAAQPKVDPKVQVAQIQAQAAGANNQQAAQLDAQTANHKAQLDRMSAEHDASIKERMALLEIQSKRMDQQMEQFSNMMKIRMQEMDMVFENRSHAIDLKNKEDKHQQSLRHADEKAKQRKESQTS